MNDEIDRYHEQRPHWTIDELYGEFDKPGNTLIAWCDDNGEEMRPGRMGSAAKAAFGIGGEDE